MKDKPIDVEAEDVKAPAGAVVKLEHPAPAAVTNPLDLEPSMFKAGLDRRKENRKSLIDWVRDALKEGVDFGRIHTVGRAKCDKGKYCKNPNHFSKPSLFKPGAEKICGMLGVTPTFPTMRDYEQAALEGKSIKSIILRCEIVNSSGQAVAVGIGARSVEQDYGDMNKALKMAEKSAHIDATLRMAGLSEVFTQDVEDMTSFGQAEPEPPGPPSSAPPTAKTQPAPASAKLPPSVVNRRKKFIENLEAAGLRDKAMQYLIDIGWLMSNEPLEKMEDRFVPVTAEHYTSFLAKLLVFSGTGKAERPFEPPPKSEIGHTPDVPRGTVNVPRDKNIDCNSPDAPWRSFPVPFGKHAGTKLADLDKNVLWGFWANYKVEKEYVGKNGQTYQTKPEKLVKDKLFREMLDEAGKHYEFTKKEEDEEGDEE